MEYILPDGNSFDTRPRVETLGFGGDWTKGRYGIEIEQVEIVPATETQPAVTEPGEPNMDMLPFTD